MSTTAVHPASSRAGRRPGRPRDDELDALLIEATLALIDAREEVTVARVVKRSNVSRAALYRRWPSLTSLIAAALDDGRTMPVITSGSDPREAVLAAFLGDPKAGTIIDLNEERFRQRIRLVVSDRQLQRTYWASHVSRRRAPIEDAFRLGVEKGLLRPGLNVEACFDAFAGAAYYQIIVRGDSLTDPATRLRLDAAFDTIWRGMLAAR